MSEHMTPVMYTDYSGYCYDYDDENNDGSRDPEQGDGCGSGGTSLTLYGGTSGSASTSGGYSSRGTSSVGGFTGSSHVINDIFPTGLNSGAGSTLSGTYSGTFYNTYGLYTIGQGQNYYDISPAELQSIRPMVRYLESHNLTPPDDHKGNKIYENRNGLLPSNGDYIKNNLYPGGGTRERLIYDKVTGQWYYSPSHYRSIFPIE